MDPMLGVLFHAMGGLAASGFYTAVGRHPPGGSTRNCIWRVWEGRKNRITANYGRACDDGSLGLNYPLCMTDGVLGYLQFFFSGSGPHRRQSIIMRADPYTWRSSSLVSRSGVYRGVEVV
jgi:hypothetical protein